MRLTTAAVSWWSVVLGSAFLALSCSSESSPGGASGGSGSQSGGASAGAAQQGGSAGSAGSGQPGGSAGQPGGGASGASGTGASGAAGASSGGGMSGSAGAPAGGMGATSGSGGGGSATPSAGCEMPAGQDLNKWVEQPKLNVAGTDRQWWVWLPTGYDPKRAYPVVFNFHGCGGSDNIVPMQRVTGDKAILVRATGITDNTCWDASPSGDDVEFFDKMLADVLAKRCADSSRVFATGYSSGSWLTNTLECVRGDKLRGAGTVSGGRPGGNKACKGKFARIFVHDRDDEDNTIEAGNDDERARLVTQNHCMNETSPYEPAPCVSHNGCDPGYPVIWCQTEGKEHARQDAFAPDLFWKLFSSL